MSLFKSTIDSVIADIKGKVDKLHVLAEAHALEAEAQAAVVAKAQAAAAFARQEEARAKAIAGKFLALISL